ncbi:MAG: hypothetical protein HY811_11260 [Planctomycetes bacterium]|nr:hypothetical protein [Planctomycetota bacterium]
MKEESQEQAQPVNYPIRTALIFLAAHTALFATILAWSWEERIFSSSGGNFILYIFEFLGVVITKAVGQAEDLTVVAPYIITFLVNSIFYAAIGFGIGSLFHELGWVEQSHNIFQTEEELSDKDKGIGQAA